MRDLVALAQRRVLAAIAEPTGFVADPEEPIDGSELNLAESRLGFTLPPLLKRLYSELGNGGFGPGYGLIGLVNGVRDDSGDSALEGYEIRRQSDPAELGWLWPAGLIPICTWGCAIYSCIDCSKPPAFPEQDGEDMRTPLFLLVGFLLLAASMLLGKLFSSNYPGASYAATWAFVALWLAIAGANMWVGVAKAGYSLTEELPIFS